jgi:hypothetical protein
VKKRIISCVVRLQLKIKENWNYLKDTHRRNFVFLPKLKKNLETKQKNSKNVGEYHRRVPASRTENARWLDTVWQILIIFDLLLSCFVGLIRLSLFLWPNPLLSLARDSFKNGLPFPPISICPPFFRMIFTNWGGCYIYITWSKVMIVDLSVVTLLNKNWFLSCSFFFVCLSLLFVHVCVWMPTPSFKSNVFSFLV